MHLTRYILAVIVLLSGTSSVQGQLMIAAGPSASSLAQATQRQDPAMNLKQGTESSTPSNVILGVLEEEGLRIAVTTSFTPEEIEKYPQHQDAFFQHAAQYLESENPQDVQSIAYLIHACPEIAGRLAALVPGRKSIHQDIKKAFATSKRPPLMTLDGAVQIAKNTPVGLVQGPLLWSTLNAVDYATHELTAYISDRRVYNKVGNATNVFDRIARKMIDRHVKEEANERWQQLKKGTVEPIRTLPQEVVSNLPRAFAINVGTAALTHLVVREWNEQVKDPLPCPSYDPKSRNITHYSCKCAKWALKEFIVPAVISSLIVAPIYDAAASTVKDTLNQPMNVLSGMDKNNW